LTLRFLRDENKRPEGSTMKS